ncbi:MAG: GNAT family N-acetyltransferase, partial [Cellulomonas sp.]
MTLREATRDDIAAVVELERLLFGADAWSEDQVREELTGERRQAWVVGDPAVGYAVTLAAGDVVDLQRIGVRPDQQRNGLARQLLDTAVAAATAARVDRMLLEVSAANTAAMAFYAA